METRTLFMLGGLAALGAVVVLSVPVCRKVKVPCLLFKNPLPAGADGAKVVLTIAQQSPSLMTAERIVARGNNPTLAGADEKELFRRIRNAGYYPSFEQQRDLASILRMGTV